MSSHMTPTAVATNFCLFCDDDQQMELDDIRRNGFFEGSLRLSGTSAGASSESSPNCDQNLRKA